MFTGEDGQTYTGFDALGRGMEKTVAALEEAGSTVWIVRPIPTFSLPVPQVVVRTMRAGRNADELLFPLADHERTNAEVEGILRDIAARHPAARFIDPLPLLCPDGVNCLVAVDGRPLYSDDNHLSAFGALRLLPAFAGFAASLKK